MKTKKQEIGFYFKTHDSDEWECIHKEVVNIPKSPFWNKLKNIKSNRIVRILLLFIVMVLCLNVGAILGKFLSAFMRHTGLINVLEDLFSFIIFV